MAEQVWHRHYDPGVPAHIDYLPLTLPQALARSAAEHPRAPALSFFSTTLSYAQLADEVQRCAGALAQRGVGRGTRVAIHMPNLPQLVIAYYAALALGGQVVMTNPLYTDDEIEHQWTDAGCTVAVVADFVWAGERIPKLRKKLPVRHWLVASIPEYLPWPLRWLARRKLARAKSPRVADLSGITGTTVFRAALAASAPRPLPAAGSTEGPALDDLAVVQYTGGTTGRSRGALLSHRNLSCNVQQLDAWLGTLTHGRECFLAALPYFHVFGMTVCMNHPVWTASHIVVLPDPRDTAAIVNAIAKQRVSVLALVPAMFHAINTHPGVEQMDLRSVKGCFSGSAPLALPVLERFEQLTGGRIFEGYGLTETSPVTHVNPLRGQRKLGSIGVPVSDTEARIVSLSDGVSDVPVGSEGELLLRGPQVMQGYWQAPAETAAALRDGWLVTGDLAVRDEDGYFRIVGRKKELILTGGYNVYPDEVDRVLAAHPAVQESATIGVPDERLGETVKSFVVLKPGATATPEQLIAHCREHLAAYKSPRALVLRSSLPRSSVLKVLRRQLLQEELEQRKSQS
ncbi:MAG: long-chain-fatty-acid--CoA ligase [Planctomycetota bacterium]